MGGEGRDFVAKWKTDRFQKHFGNISNLHNFGGVDYVQVKSVWLIEETLR